MEHDCKTCYYRFSETLGFLRDSYRDGGWHRNWRADCVSCRHGFLDDECERHHGRHRSCSIALFMALSYAVRAGIDIASAFFTEDEQVFDITPLLHLHGIASDVSNIGKADMDKFLNIIA